MKYEIIKNTMALERGQVNLIYLNLHIAIWSWLPRITVIFFKKMLMYIFLISLTVTRGNVL